MMNSLLKRCAQPAIAKRCFASTPANAMSYRYLGKSGLKVSAISLGAWTTWGLSINDEMAYKCMKTALKMGVNFFDNAEIYGSGKAEKTMGTCISKLIHEGMCKRSDLVISTKLYWGGKGPNDRGLSRKHLIEGTQASLSRLGLDYVDLLFAHRPDIDTPMEEIVRAMNYLINHGKCFYWGTSEWSAAQLVEAYTVAEKLHLIGPTMEQPQYNMLCRSKMEREYKPIFSHYTMGTTIWSPLCSGLLSGKYTSLQFPEGSRLANKHMAEVVQELEHGEGFDMGKEVKGFEGFFHIIERLRPIATQLNCSLSQLAIAWCLHNPNVSTVITGATKVAQIEENIKALQVLPKLTPEVVEAIEKALGNAPQQPFNFRNYM
eukprot:TRINITY_DN2492_c0_g1_i1.p1 TRINITY_DN2492_c0_g1~~TRINITY_DN2492_c0_g1_i1.p1  ORF type:complete len:375 (+),score=68.48 TRINITY_DN2492_c0_g1_i1:64-1188(+)